MSKAGMLIESSTPIFIQPADPLVQQAFVLKAIKDNLIHKTTSFKDTSC